jgi:hypothetical protein
MCGINNMALRAAHDLLAARPHAQWDIFMLQCTDELGAVWNAHLLGPDHPANTRPQNMRWVTAVQVFEATMLHGEVWVTGFGVPSLPDAIQAMETQDDDL